MEYGYYNAFVPDLHKRLGKLVESGKLDRRSIVFYGITAVHEYAIEYLKSKNNVSYKIKAIIDRSADERGTLTKSGIPVIGAEKYLKNPDREDIFLIGGNYFDSMKKTLIKSGYKEDDIIQIFDPYSLIRSNGREISEEEEKQIQFEELICLRNICEELGIRYYLAFGTLIGAIRHRGFIPWDNDIDIFIHIKDIQKLYNAIENQFQNGKYELLVPGISKNYPFLYAQLIDTGTIRESVDFPFKVTMGLGIDISLLTDMGDTLEEARIFRDECFAYSLEYRRSIDKEQNCREITFDELSGRISRHDGKKKYRYVGSIFGNNYDAIFLSEWFELTKKVEFEGEMFDAPAGYDELLKHIYGNYMTPPPISEQNCSNHIWKNYWRD